MKKQPTVTAQTRKNLMDSFWNLYCKKRIDRITVKEITSNAGYNRSTFYEYFTDVYQLLEELELSLLRNQEQFQKLSDPDFFMQTEDIINDFPIDIFMRMYEKQHKYFTVLLGEHGDPSFQVRIKNELKPRFKEVIVSKGAEDNFKLDIMLEYNISAIIGVLSYWFSIKEEQRPPIEVLFRTVSELMKQCMLTVLRKAVTE